MSFGSNLTESQLQELALRFKEEGGLAPKYIGTPTSFEEAARMNDWYKARNEGTCLHKACSNCSGSGVGKDGGPCIHGISCPCPDCNFR